MVDHRLLRRMELSRRSVASRHGFLLAFEFIEGNTITRLYFMRLRRLAREALAAERMTPELARWDN
jgi:hypothetical protein